MTEDEAKIKWCCGAPAYVDAALRTMKDMPAPGLKCMGAACMAWREVTELRDFDATGKDITLLSGTYAGVTHQRVPVGGYCGLAGQPQ